jgi:hypothetical protein
VGPAHSSFVNFCLVARRGSIERIRYKQYSHPSAPTLMEIKPSRAIEPVLVTQSIRLSMAALWHTFAALLEGLDPDAAPPLDLLEDDPS